LYQALFLNRFVADTTAMKNIALKYEVMVFLMRCFAFGCTFGIGGTGQPSFRTSASLAAFNSYAELYLPLCEFPAYLMAHVRCLHMGLNEINNL